ncbi:MAG: hypothetical protein MUE44_08230 [Oscillatoriaceae cyanobacterium Prado104]|nr:hypothetical protein [Oscillatoriaceae cyanobacterium Prado104]
MEKLDNARYPMPDARYPMPDARCPMPNSQFPIPNSQFPIPNSQFPIPNSQLSTLPSTYQDCGESIVSEVTLPVLPHAGPAQPRFYGGKMQLLILLIMLLAIGSLLTQLLVLLPIAWLGWLHIPNWLSMTSIVLCIAWCLVD